MHHDHRRRTTTRRSTTSTHRAAFYITAVLAGLVLAVIGSVFLGAALRLFRLVAGL